MLEGTLAATAALLLVASAVLWIWRGGPRLAEGSVAPEFALADQDGNVRRLADYAGRWLVLYFYPKDDTPGCTKQACHLRDAPGLVDDPGVSLVGISTDTVASHARFARTLRLPFPLLADPDGRTARAYDSLLNLGVVKIARRHTFVITPEGRIAARFDKVDPVHHAEDVARVIGALRSRGSGAV